MRKGSLQFVLGMVAMAGMNMAREGWRGDDNALPWAVGAWVAALAVLWSVIDDVRRPCNA